MISIQSDKSLLIWSFHVRASNLSAGTLDLNVNGIPQVSLFDADANLQVTYIGKQQEQVIKESIDNLYNDFQINSQIQSSEFSTIKENKNYQASPRSHSWFYSQFNASDTDGKHLINTVLQSSAISICSFWVPFFDLNCM